MSRDGRQHIAVGALILWASAGTAFGETPVTPDTEYVFLVTGDGIRHQEVFGGVDPRLVEESSREASGIEDLEAFRRDFWTDEARARREKLLPFFWTELARQGVVLGNRARNSRVEVKNPHRFSYPGYAEILNGQPLAEVDSNDPRFSPRPTILEHLRERLDLGPSQVAAFASWSVFNWITMQRENAVFCNAGYEPMPGSLRTAGMRRLDELQFEMRTPWDTVRHDAVTLGLALEYVETYKPRFLYLALGETDDWAHDRRYDRSMQALRLFDDALRRLWSLVQSIEPYRGKTTLIVTTDHGRGRTPEDWTSHGKDVPGSEEIWIGVFGPDTLNRGELADTPAYHQSNIAATILSLYGLDSAAFNPRADPAIAEVLASPPRD